MLKRLKKEGRTVVDYGASGRSTTIMNYCGIDGRYLDYVIDDAPSKKGFLTPGTHLPISSWPAEGEKPTPDYIAVFAWSFIDGIRRRHPEYLKRGGKFILPLPKVQVVAG